MTSSKVKIDYLGPKYTFSHEAAIKMFPKAEHYYSLSPKELFDKVDNGERDYGIFPVENSATGVIPEFFHLLLDQEFQHSQENQKTTNNIKVKVKIKRELYLPIFHHLMSKSKITLSEIETVYTFRQPYLQCVDWINNNLGDHNLVYTHSTADAAEKVAQDSKGACIGGNLLAKMEGLNIIRDNIQDYSLNTTRFFAISSKKGKPTKSCDKSTFAIIIPNEVGALVKVLQMISSQELNILNVKMLPVRDSVRSDEVWEDWFMIDVDCNSTSEPFNNMLNEFRENKDVVNPTKVLGSYVNKLGRPGRVIKQKKEKKEKSIPDKVEFIKEIIKGGESEKVEFKSSFRYDMKTRGVNKNLPRAIAKTLCAFMNTKEGCLLIGISDDGEVIGIENDINLVPKKNIDNFLTMFYQAVSDFIGNEFSRFIHPEIIEIYSKKVCCIHVDLSDKPAWLKEGNNYTLFTRVGNATKPLDAKKANEYVMSKFKLK